MIRPAIENKETTADIIESRFFKTSVKKHKKRIVQRSRYADENPLLTAGFVLIIMVSLGFLMVGNIASAKTKQLEGSGNEFNSAEPEIIKTQDSDNVNDSDTEEKVANVSDSTQNDNNLYENLEVSLPASITEDVDSKRFYTPHRNSDKAQPLSESFEKRLATDNSSAQ